MTTDPTPPPDLLLPQALALHQQGQLAAAANIYQAILATEPLHYNALQLLGTVCAQTGQFGPAVTLFEKALTLDAQNPTVWNNLGNALTALGQAAAALPRYDRAIALAPEVPDFYFNRGNAHKALSQWEAALQDYAAAIARQPDSAQALNNQGIVLKQLQRLPEAQRSYEAALALQPHWADAHNNLGNVLKDLGHAQAALAHYDQALALQPEYANAHYNRALVLSELSRFKEAKQAYQQALRWAPQHAESHYNLGKLHQDDKNLQAALACYDQALACQPHFSQAHNNRGNVLQLLKQWPAALAAYQQALALEPTWPQAHYNAGVVYQAMQQWPQAIACFEQALALHANYPEAYYNLGVVRQEQKQLPQALALYEHALALRPDYDYLSGIRLYAQLNVADWTDFASRSQALDQAVQRGHKASPPFSYLPLSDSPELQKRCAQTWVADKYPSDPALGALTHGGHETPSRRIKVGYFSPDFREHAVSFLTAEWFELHDPVGFETFAFSLSPPRLDSSGAGLDPMRARLQQAFDHFLEVDHLSDLDIARQARALGLDVAVDLCGFTGQHRMGVFAARAAPLQISYLGYLGTSGAPYMDYLVADEVLVPAHEAAHYSEKILYLPCYQVNDRQRPQVMAELDTDPVARVDLRRAQGLPEKGFVYVCFNNPYKINPAVFDDWMAILQAVPDSVLWLLTEHPDYESQLRSQAELRGVAAQRLVFAPRAERQPYLDRYAMADLFLDTRPYNAGTTASDALWAGLPVLTCPGRSFSSRMAASLLTGLNCPELIASDRLTYVQKAIEWGRTGTQQLKAALAERRWQAPLFDTPRFARAWEAALIQLLSSQKHPTDQDTSCAPL